MKDKKVIEKFLSEADNCAYSDSYQYDSDDYMLLDKKGMLVALWCGKNTILSIKPLGKKHKKVKVIIMPNPMSSSELEYKNNLSDLISNSLIR